MKEYIKQNLKDQDVEGLLGIYLLICKDHMALPNVHVAQRFNEMHAAPTVTASQGVAAMGIFTLVVAAAASDRLASVTMPPYPD